MRFLAVAIAVASLLGCQSKPNNQKSEAELTSAIDAAMADARRALSEHGDTDAAMEKIQAALARLATVPGLRERAKLGPLHGATTTTAGKLASDGENATSLFVGRLAANTTTPVHDHLTWGCCSRFSHWT